MKKETVVFLPYKLHIRHLLEALAQKVRLVTLLPPEKELSEGSDLEGIPITYAQFGANLIKPLIGREIRTQKYARGLPRTLKNLQVDVLITCEFYHWYTVQSIAYKKRNKKLKLFVISETKKWPRNRVARLIKWMLLQYFKLNYRHIDGIFVYTEAARDFLLRYVPNADVTLLPVPIDTNVFNRIPDKHFLERGKLRLLMNARSSPYKRHKDIFAAIKRLHKDGKEIHLTCVSRYEDDRVGITELAHDMGVSELVSVIDTVSQDEVPQLNGQHDVLVLPSYNEAIGMVVPEAMACGIPTITSDTVGANVYVKDGETGFIFKTGDVDALTGALNKCFDKQLLANMGDAAHRHIVDNFTPEKVADHMYHSLFGKHV